MKNLRTTLALLLSIALAGGLAAQDLRLSFLSQTGARFYVYLNGKLQNQQPTGHITLKGLEDKTYHVRIEIDDPYQMALTRKMRPKAQGHEYTVNFNAVRERIYLKRQKENKQNKQNKKTR